MLNRIIDESVNYIVLDITIFNQRLRLINLYGSNNDDPIFIQNIADLIDRMNNDKYILCGYFNCILNTTLDSYNYKHINNPTTRDQVIEMINTNNMIDPFRENFPLLKRYTWRNPIETSKIRLFPVFRKW